MQEGKDDKDVTINDTSTLTQVPVSTPTQVPISGPITRTRTYQFNHQVSSLLSSYPSYLDHGDVCTLVLVRNQGEDRKGKGLSQTGFGLHDSTTL